MYTVILYYNFAKIENPPKFCEDQRRKCRELNLLGRIYVAEEGINGTLGGSPENVEAYKDFLRSQPGFESTEFKDDPFDQIPFVKLVVKVRPELATLRSPVPLDVTRERGNYLEPEEWCRVLESEGDYVLIDVRNNYESAVGHFEGALRPDVENFFDFPKWLDDAEKDIPKNKKVLMYCTGGIRCEKFSVLMEKKGYKDVYQLHGGIINYAKKIQGAPRYKGKCFVFDDRLTVPIEQAQKKPLTRCAITDEPCDRYLNCANPDCNKLFICSEEGAKKMEGCCSPECLASERRRPFDPDNIYEPTRKWYTYQT